MNRTTVAVLYGGRSTEHSVSCVSAGAVMAHLDRSVYNVIPVGITESGVWTLGPDDVSDLRITNRVLPVVDPHRPEVSIGLSTEDRGVLRFVDGDRAGEQIDRVDVVFPVMHGTHAEDGTIQGLLELSGIPYVGPGVLASAAGMDKEFTKIVLGAAGLPIGHQTVLRPGTPTLTSADRERLGLPLFVKPARGGSSIGITKVSRYEDLDAAISEARRYDPKVIIEAAVVGREIECGVLEYPDGTVAASLPAELHVPGVSTGPEDEAGAGTFYDFDTKYLDNVTTFDLPAELSEEETEQLRALAVRAHQAIDARGLSRVDFFVTEDGPVINEINTMPGFTPISMYPQMWAATDVDYSTLLDTLLRTALAGR